MYTIGITGISGSGKSEVAGILARFLSSLGYQCAVDCFAAPIKWLCRARGWDGVKTERWRRAMQLLATESRRTRFWFSTVEHEFLASTRFADGFTGDERFAHMELGRLEAIADDWDADKFVMWLAARNGISMEFQTRRWHENWVDRYQVHPDFLIVHDVRYPAEAEFCRDMGVLLHKEGVSTPLPEIQAAHESERHIADIAAMAFATIFQNRDRAMLDGAVERVALDIINHLSTRRAGSA